MGAVYGALAALSIGLADLFSRQIVLRRGPNVAAMMIQVVATLASLAMVPVIASRFGWRDVAIGALSGIGLALGLAAYLGGLARSSSAVVAPIVATLSAVIPFGYAVARGAPSSGWAVSGAMIAVAGLVLVTAGGEPVANVAAGTRWALAAGLGYGFGLSVVIEADESSGAWPAVGQRAAAMLIMVLVVSRSQARVPLVGVRTLGVAAGVVAALSTVFYLLGVQADPTPAVVTASMFPAVTVAVGRMVFHDSVSRVQALGLGVVLVGVTAVVAA